MKTEIANAHVELKRYLSGFKPTTKDEQTVLNYWLDQINKEVNFWESVLGSALTPEIYESQKNS